ncbi:MAG: hypothetical protein ABIO46_15140 [Chitinophagales bacterium]
MIALILAISQPAVAQEIAIEFKADSSHIVIGDYLNVKLTARVPNELTVVMPPVANTVGNMELLNASEIDTAVSSGYKTFTQTYTLSAYDSGTYRAGPQKIIFKDNSGTADTVFSDSILISVTTLPVDTAKAFKAIKAPIDVPYTLNEFLPYIIGGIILLAIIAAVAYYVRRRKNQKPKVIQRPKPKDPPHVWARRELKKLEDEKLWQKDESKMYYSRLTDILRMYLEYRYGWFALESTTEKIGEDIERYGMSEDAKKNLLLILNEGDLVKFAKHVPMPDLNVRVMERAYSFIELTEQKEVVQEVK